ncbi:MAG: phosphoribosylanthranilate isomerase [Rhodospirillaceae bacterium]
MTPTVKICGLRDAAAVAAAVEAGAEMVGFVFFPPSPRSMDVDAAAALTAAVPPGVTRVALSVDADDDLLAAIADRAGVDMLQLHGKETPKRVTEIRARFGLPVMKAVAIAGPKDVVRARTYEAVADRLMFDAKPPKDATRPGGNALTFDWELIAGETWAKPWVLAGGLTVDNVAEAIRVSGAAAVDVSSGVEDAPGDKNPEKIRAFVAAAKSA